MASFAGLASLRPVSVSRQAVAARKVNRHVVRAEGSPSANGTSVAYHGPLDFDELADIIRKVNDTDIVDLVLNSKRFSLSLKKKEALKQPEVVFQAAPVAAAPMAAPAPAPAAAPAPAPAAPAPAAKPAPAAAPAPPKASGMEITSPMAGTFYTAPAPGEPAFAKVGDTVTKGQCIGIIEAMKLMNEIEAEISGTVVEILVKNAEPVLPGQPIMIIAP